MQEKVAQTVDDSSSKNIEEDPNAVAKRIAAQWTSNPEAGRTDPGDSGAAKKAAVSGGSSSGSEACGDDSTDACDTSGAKGTHPTAKESSKSLLSKVAKTVGSVLGKGSSVSENGVPSSQEGDTQEVTELATVKAAYEEAASTAAKKQQELSDVDEKLADARTRQSTVWFPLLQTDSSLFWRT
jgi:hypothetical protein